MPFKLLLAALLLGTLPGLYSQVPPSYSISICTDQSTGYYFTTPAKPITTEAYSVSFNIILDQRGELVYFRTFTGNAKACDLKLQPNGLISYFSDNKYYLMDESFRIIDSVCCKNGVITDSHDLKILPNGHFLVLGVDKPFINLESYKIFKPGNCAGSPNATVACGVIQELDKKKNLVFEWKSRDHFKFMEMDTFYINDPKGLDWTHFNALEPDTDGNILLSVRNFNEITKINRKDGRIMWRMGGKQNQFNFKNDSLMFLSQHDIRRLPNGNITLFDNGRQTVSLHAAYAKEYKINETTRTAELVWKYANDSTMHSGAGLGNVQRLANGNTLVNYGRSNKSKTMFSVITPSGSKCFEMEFKNASLSYRVFNYPELKISSKRPVIKVVENDGKTYLDAGKGYKEYIWSNGATTRIIPLNGYEKFWVGIKLPDGGYLVSEPFYPQK